jgi:hypothetical protein
MRVSSAASKSSQNLRCSNVRRSIGRNGRNENRNEQVQLFLTSCKDLSAKLTHDTLFQPDRMLFRAHGGAESVQDRLFNQVLRSQSADHLSIVVLSPRRSMSMFGQPSNTYPIHIVLCPCRHDSCIQFGLVLVLLSPRLGRP